MAPGYKLGRMDRSRARALIALTVLALVGLALVGSVSSASAHTRPTPLVEEPSASIAAVAVAASPVEPPAPATIWLALVCAVALVSTHLQGTEQPVAPDGVWSATPIGAMTTPDVDRPGSRPLRPDEGRAPPAA